MHPVGYWESYARYSSNPSFAFIQTCEDLRCRRSSVETVRSKLEDVQRDEESAIASSRLSLQG